MWVSHRSLDLMSPLTVRFVKLLFDCQRMQASVNWSNKDYVIRL